MYVSISPTMEAPEARLRLKTSNGRTGAGFENLSTATSR